VPRQSGSRLWGVVVAMLLALAGMFVAYSVVSGRERGSEPQMPANAASPADAAETEEQPLIPREVIEESPFFFELPARSGNKTKLNFADVVMEHNLVLYFWSARCPLCLLQTRSVNQLARWAEEHPKANLQVISISLDALGSRMLEQGAVQPEIEFPVFYDPEGAHTRKGYMLEESGLPAFYFFLQGGLPVRVVSGFKSGLVNLAKESFISGALRSGR